jgi:hypothetical protein
VQVRDAVAPGVVRGGEATLGVVSGKSLARPVLVVCSPDASA